MRAGFKTLAIIAIAGSLQAQTVFTSGLLNPSKIILGPSGTMLVSEVNTTPNSGRVSIVSAGGVRKTLIEGLPSGIAGADADGPTGLVLEGKTLYIAIGEGDELRPGPAPRTAVPNPEGPSSPILDSILKVTFSQSVDLFAGSVTLKAADHLALADGETLTLDDGSGGKVTVNLLSTFRYRPEAGPIYRNSHPYALTKMTTDAKQLYLANAGLNSLVEIDTETGRARTVVKFPPQPNRGTTGAPVVDAVPDNLRVFGSRLLVNLLTGFPFAPGNSKVLSVDPATGNTEVLVDNLNSSIDVVWRARFFGRLQFYVLEYSANQVAQAPGRLKLIENNEVKVLVDNLKSPTSMVLDAPAGKLYITSRADGSVLLVDIGQ